VKKLTIFIARPTMKNMQFLDISPLKRLELGEQKQQQYAPHRAKVIYVHRSNLLLQ
jgi:hypothetical protein